MYDLFIHHFIYSPFHLSTRAYNIDEYPCKSKHAAAIMLMIMNNLDPKVAQVKTVNVKKILPL